MRIHPVKFGVAFGIVYALTFFVFGAMAALFGWGAEFADFIGVFYPGFGPSFAGAFIGAVWGFGVGFVFFAFAAWIYNKLVGNSGTQY